MGANPRHVLSALALAAVLLVLDRLTKLMVMGAVLPLPPPRRIPVLPFLDLVAVANRGVSFGLFNDHGLPAIVFVGISLAVTVFLLIWLCRGVSLWASLALGLVIGGALGNTLDRILLGAVFDFLDFHIAGWHWPAFNLADSGIVIGVALLLLDGVFDKTHKNKKHAQKESS
ncbi:MAG: signal peptidase II [Alphaproteobacteria bacterium]|nr:MAG: signal peptidase II [Alphaproteobacteria bacterium]